MSVFPDRFVQGIEEDNPWWRTGKMAQPPPSFKRSDYKHYVDELEAYKVNIIIGPRRVGKTTLIFQLIEYLLEVKKVNPKSILFASLERPYFELLPQKLDGALQFFEEKIYGKPTTNAGETAYLFIDEAQYDSTWSRLMKQYMDQKRPIHAVVSGSSATAIYQDSESGAGRFHERQMVTMKLRDVLRLRFTQYDKEIKSISYELRSALVQSCVEKNIKPFEDAMNRITITPELKSVIVSGTEEYLLKGGYPEFYFEDWKKISQYYQQNVFDVILQKDVVNTFQIRFPEKIRSLLVVIAQNTARLLSRTRLCQSLGITNARTVDEYTDALSQAFLIRTCTKFKEQGYPSTKVKKFYAADTGLRNAVLGVEDRSLTTDERGQLLETAVLNHSFRLGFYIDHRIRNQGYYWGDDESERDIVIDIRETHKMVLPIEVKNGGYGNEDMKKMRDTISKLKAPFGIIVCRERAGSDGQVLVMPPWAFMLSC